MIRKGLTRRKRRNHNRYQMNTKTATGRRRTGRPLAIADEELLPFLNMTPLPTIAYIAVSLGKPWSTVRGAVARLEAPITPDEAVQIGTLLHFGDGEIAARLVRPVFVIREFTSAFRQKRDTEAA